MQIPFLIDPAAAASKDGVPVLPLNGFDTPVEGPDTTAIFMAEMSEDGPIPATPEMQVIAPAVPPAPFLIDQSSMALVGQLQGGPSQTQTVSAAEAELSLHTEKGPSHVHVPGGEPDTITQNTSNKIVSVTIMQAFGSQPTTDRSTAPAAAQSPGTASSKPRADVTAQNEQPTIGEIASLRPTAPPSAVPPQGPAAHKRLAVVTDDKASATPAKVVAKGNDAPRPAIKTSDALPQANQIAEGSPRSAHSEAVSSDAAKSQVHQKPQQFSMQPQAIESLKTERNKPTPMLAKEGEVLNKASPKSEEADPIAVRRSDTEPGRDLPKKAPRHPIQTGSSIQAMEMPAIFDEVTDRQAGSDPLPLIETRRTDAPAFSSPILRSEAQRAVMMQLAQVPLKPDQPVELRLDPQELGHVRIVLSSQEQSLTLVMSAERPETLDLMRRHVDQLAQEFHEMGYTDLNFSFAEQDGASDQQGASSGSHTQSSEVEPSESEPQILTLGMTGGLDIRL